MATGRTARRQYGHTVSSQLTDQVRVTWWGHATVEVQEPGLRLLTDPVLRNRLAHLRRRRGPVPAPGPPDVVLLSHLHADHVDLPSLRQLRHLRTRTRRFQRQATS